MKDLTLLVLASLFAASGGDSHEKESQLICSDEPVVALAGEDVILPCHLEPPMGPGSGKVLWSKPGLDKKFILVYHQGQMIREEQNPSYEKRTALFEDQLKDGNVSLKLSRVKVSDAGRYLCTHEAAVKNTYIHLTVGAASSVITVVVSSNSDEVTLQCRSEGWYPEPEVLWLDHEGSVIPAGSAETVGDPDVLFNVSSRVRVDVQGNYICRVQQKNTKQTREAHIYVQAKFFFGDIAENLFLLNTATLPGLAALMFIDIKKWNTLSFMDQFQFYLALVAMGLIVMLVSVDVMRMISENKFHQDLFSFYWILTVDGFLAIFLLMHFIEMVLNSCFLRYPLTSWLAVINASLVGLFVVMQIIVLRKYSRVFKDAYEPYCVINFNIYFGAAALMFTNVKPLIHGIMRLPGSVERILFKKRNAEADSFEFSEHTNPLVTATEGGRGCVDQQRAAAQQKL